MTGAPFTAVVTGGASGIGRATAGAMLARGWRVIALDREAPADPPRGLVHVAADLLDPGATRAAAAAIASGHEVTHLVHSAGLIWPAPVESARPEDILGLAQLHLAAALTLAQAFLPAMKARRFGRILFVGSRAALGVPTRSAYGATKAAMVGMARTWALELAPHGITVNVVAPGPVRTPNFWDIVPKDSPREAELAARIPVGRLGEPADVARALMFFADPEAGFVTGQVLHVCGGASVGAFSL
jgi:NAD(P)-dependent dehydrogenase (short-subunit alcohol dehydrogenase family)